MEERIFQGMEYAYEVYKEGSFQKASQNLFISQPSISASVRRIEERIGCQIFDRSVKPLKLTECGEKYIEAVEKIMSMEREFSEYVSDIGELKRGSLIVGGSGLFSSLVIAPILQTFKLKYPMINVKLIEENTSNLEKMLQKGLIDIVIDYPIGNEEIYDSTVLEEDCLVLAVPKHYSINKKLREYHCPPEILVTSKKDEIPPVPLKNFEGMPFILLKPENSSRKQADEICAECDFVPNITMELDQQMSAYMASISGIGITFVGLTLISRITPSRELVYYRLGSEHKRRQVCIFYKKGRYVTKAMEEFMKTAKMSKQL